MKQQNSTIKAYLRVFINFEQNYYAMLLPKTESAYNNAKNRNIGHTSFKLKCGYHPRVSFKKNINCHFRSKLADELSSKLEEPMIVCQNNLDYAQKIQK